MCQGFQFRFSTRQAIHQVEGTDEKNMEEITKAEWKEQGNIETTASAADRRDKKSIITDKNK